MLFKIRKNKLKKYNDIPSHLPDGGNIVVHTSEVARQAIGVGVSRNGWVGGDAWFSSASSCLESKKRMGINSTFVIKNNINFFSMIVLYRILQARHGKRPLGHWIVIKTTIAEVELIAIAYAWSQRELLILLVVVEAQEFIMKSAYQTMKMMIEISHAKKLIDKKSVISYMNFCQ